MQFVELTAADAADLAALLTEDPPEYGKYFVPFPETTPEALGQVLSRARRDQYRGIREGGRLIGFYMLRGFDAGYTRPSFGVYIAAHAAGKGLARRALESAIAWCREREIAAMMLKVHPLNTPAYNAYLSAGFTVFDTCSRTGHLMMQKELL